MVKDPSALSTERERGRAVRRRRRRKFDIRVVRTCKLEKESPGHLT
jgi:hypothetical protein